MFGKTSQIKDRQTMADDIKIPEHIAIIMDGNGRWAKRKGFPRIFGHREGMKAVRHTVMTCSDLGVQTLTLYAFSTENWSRPNAEVTFLMKAPGKFLSTYLPELIENNVRVQIMGSRRDLPDYTLKAIQKAIDKTKQNTGLVLNFAWNYGARFEITEAARAVAEDVEKQRLSASALDEDTFADYLLTRGLSDPDLLIRTSGEIRLSNFMLWQLAYTELWFTDVLWPDFDEEQLKQAIATFSSRGRRYGNI